MKNWKGKRFFKVCVFAAIFVFLFGSATWLLQPYSNENFIRTASAFYDEPEDTIETIFLGTSVAYHGFSPMVLYEDYGICSYNLGSNTQPLMISYYWMVEAYKYQSGSLKTVVVDMAMMKKDAVESNYQTALFGMRFSANKYHAIRDISDTLEDFVYYAIPFTSYHSRWKKLEEEFFTIWDPNEVTASRGYKYTTYTMIESTSYDKIGVPEYILDEDAGEEEFNEEFLFYLEKMAEFCEEHNLELILTKTPTIDTVWTDEMHNAVESFAEEYGLEFIDFNYAPYLDEIEFNAATDVKDTKHLNADGAKKLSDWFGEYLTEYCGATDVRGAEGFEFMEEELEIYKEQTELRAQEEAEEKEEDDDERDLDNELELYNLRFADACKVKELMTEGDTDLESYLDAFWDDEDYIVLLYSQGTLPSFDESIKDTLSALGCTVLSEIESGQSYAGISVGGEVVDEVSGDEGETLTLSYTEYFTVSGTDLSLPDLILTAKKNYNLQEDSLNVIIYNAETGLLVDTAAFDSHGEMK